MSFIEVTTKKGNKILVNILKIQMVRKEEEGSMIIFSEIDYVEELPNSLDSKNIYHYESLEIKESYEHIKFSLPGYKTYSE